MLPSFLLAETHEAMEPLIFSSLEHFTSTVALNPILNSPFGSLAQRLCVTPSSKLAPAACKDG